MKPALNLTCFEPFPFLETERLNLEPFKPSDAPDLFAIRSDGRVMKYMDMVPHQTVADSKEMITGIQKSYQERTGINWAVHDKTTGNFAGYFGFWRIMANHCRAEIGYALKPEFWGKGFMTEALIRLIEFGFADLNLHSIEANVNPENTGSIQLLLKTGFKKEAHFRENYLFNGQFIDSAIYCLLSTD